MRATSLKAAAVASTAAIALTAGATAAVAAEPSATHRLSATSKTSASVAVATKTFRGGTLTVAVDATGSKSIKHLFSLSVDGKLYKTGSYKENDLKKSWTFTKVPSGEIRLSAPAAKGQITSVTLQWN
jgi:hypothetical protein